MIVALVILAISLLAMAAMLLVGHLEIKKGEKRFLVPARDWAEKKMHQLLHAAKGVIQTAVSRHFWESLGKCLTQFFVKYVWQHPKMCAMVNKATDVVRGKKEIKSKGPVSFYLKDVSEFKEKVRSR